MSRRDVEHVLGVYVADLVRDDGEHLLVVEALDELRVQHDDGVFDSAGEGVDGRVLLDEKLRHVHAERGAGDLQLGVEVWALPGRDLHGAGREDDADGRLARHLQ